MRKFFAVGGAALPLAMVVTIGLVMRGDVEYLWDAMGMTCAIVWAVAWALGAFVLKLASLARRA